MAADVITFDSDYMQEYAKTVADAQKLVDEARASLKKANRHDGWRCSERHSVNESLSDLSSKLDKISIGLKETSSTLVKGARQFSDLETRAAKEENSLSGQLKKNWGFEALKWIAGVIGGIGQKVGDFLNGLLPVTQVPPSPSPTPVIVAPPGEGETAIMPETLADDAAAEETIPAGGGWEKLQEKVKYDIANRNGEGEAFWYEKVEQGKGNYKGIFDAEGNLIGYEDVGKGNGDYTLKTRQCKVYAQELVKAANGKGLPRTADNNYSFIEDNENLSKFNLEKILIKDGVAKEGLPGLTADQLYEFFKEHNVRKGDVIQIGNSQGMLHTAIVNSYDDKGVYVTDANWGMGGEVKENHLIPWSTWQDTYMKAEKATETANVGISVYRPTY
jgi:hypothetical protein